MGGSCRSDSLYIDPNAGFCKTFVDFFEGYFCFRLPSAKESTLGLLSLLALQRVFEVYQSLQDQVPVPSVCGNLLNR